MNIRSRLAKLNRALTVKPECACELSSEENWRGYWVPVCGKYVASMIRGKKAGPSREICATCVHDKGCHKPRAIPKQSCPDHESRNQLTAPMNSTACADSS